MNPKNETPDILNPGEDINSTQDKAAGSSESDQTSKKGLSAASDENEFMGQPQTVVSAEAGETENDRAEDPSAFNESKLKDVIEALIFTSEQPLSLEKIAVIVKECPKSELKGVINGLIQDYQEREGALEIVEVANGYQVRTRSEFSPWIVKLRQQRTVRLSRAALETLAIVAYHQPATRAEVESIRGVDAGAVLSSLLEKRQIRILGRKEVPGRPIIYGTTKEFLELFGLKNLKELPSLREINNMFPDPPPPGSVEAGEAQKTDESVAPSQQELDSSISASEPDEVADDIIEADEDSIEDQDGEISTVELDSILKYTKTRLDHYVAEQEIEATSEGPDSDDLESEMEEAESLVEDPDDG